jgi:hypothetical protein
MQYQSPHSMPAQVVGMLRIEVCDWEESFLA